MEAASGVERTRDTAKNSSYLEPQRFVSKTKRTKRTYNFMIKTAVSRGGCQGDGETMMMTHGDGWRAIDLLA